MRPPLSQRSIFLLFAPLAASWALMMMEYPIIQVAIARLPDVKEMLAAAGLVIGVEITIESPVIMLLATTTALARTPAAYRVLRRFTIHLNLLVTAVAALVAFVPFFYDGLVTGLLGIPGAIAESARPAMQVMTLWSAAIGWRRFQQGILIRHGRTRAVSLGTLVRLVCAAGTAISLAHLGTLPGVMVGAWAWMAGVTAEAAFVHIVTRRTIREVFLGADLPGATPVTYGQVARFHAPLAATSLLSLLVAPTVQAGLSRMPLPEENLAAWPVLFAVLLFFRSPGFALPEAVIALLDGRDRVAPLRRFSLLLAVVTAGALTLFLAGPLFGLYVDDVVRVPASVRPFLRPALFAGLALPAVQALQSWYRGVLMTAGRTGAIYVGMGIALALTIGGVAISVWQQLPGTLSCVAAITVGAVAEALFLGWASGRAMGLVRDDADVSAAARTPATSRAAMSAPRR